MSARSTLDPDATPGTGAVRPPGHDTRSIGPSDLSDTGSDSIGPGGYDPAVLDSDSDSVGTGVDPSPGERNDVDPGGDIGVDRIVGAGEAGLGGGLDQAEEARYGITDETLDTLDEAGPGLEPDDAADDGADERADEADEPAAR